jgi:hypothetical protein
LIFVPEPPKGKRYAIACLGPRGRYAFIDMLVDWFGEERSLGAGAGEAWSRRNFVTDDRAARRTVGQWFLLQKRWRSSRNFKSLGCARVRRPHGRRD